MRSRLAARRRGLQRPTLSSWTCFHAPPKSSRWIGPMSPASLELRSSTSGSSSVHIPSLKGGSCHFSAICIERSPVPGSSHFPLALLTRRPLTSPTLWVLWSRFTLPWFTLGRSMAASVAAERHLCHLSIWLRFMRRKRCFWWTHPSHNLGYLGRRLAL